MVIERGDLVNVKFDSDNIIRPAIVLSPQRFNEITGFISLCPIVEDKKGWGYEVDLPNDSAFNGVILTDQIKNLNLNDRYIEKKGQVPFEVVRECLDKIETFLYY